MTHAVQPAGGAQAGGQGKSAASDDGWGALDDFGSVSAAKAPAKSAPKGKPLKLGGATKLDAKSLDDWDDW